MAVITFQRGAEIGMTERLTPGAHAMTGTATLGQGRVVRIGVFKTDRGMAETAFRGGIGVATTLGNRRRHADRDAAIMATGTNAGDA